MTTTAFTPPNSTVGVGPAAFGAAVTPANTDLPNLTRAVYVGGTGDLVVTFAGVSGAVTFKAVPVGTVLPICVRQINAATTATQIVAMW